MLSFALPLIFAAQLQTALHLEELIFPPHAQHNHSSCIIETPEGDLLAVWFRGTGERQADDVRLMGARKKNGAEGWSEAFVMADTPDLPDCNPVLFVDAQKKLWLLWVAIQANEWGSALLKYRTSTDYAGDDAPNWTWQGVVHTRPTDLEAQFLKVIDEGMEKLGALLPPEKAEELVKTARGAATDKLQRRLGWMTRLQPITTQDGRMMVGLYSDVFNCSLAMWTSDGGETWEFSEPIMDENVTELGNIQPALVQRKNGDIVAYMRDNGLFKSIKSSVSTDGGRTWSGITRLPIRNPGSSVAAIALQSGAWVMLANDTMNGRHQLAVFLSDDEGNSWPLRAYLEKMEPDAGHASYPSVTQGADGTIHCSYSFHEPDMEGVSIKHTAIDEAWIRENAQPVE
ncbi:MAG: exo-alpha-sialidase [Candidatus Hydrogenedentes bacterium]|nr:exo-alpha-sialidase [Candidatus Hydrogenedentota bacterium]